MIMGNNQFGRLQLTIQQIYEAKSRSERNTSDEKVIESLVEILDLWTESELNKLTGDLKNLYNANGEVFIGLNYKPT